MSSGSCVPAFGGRELKFKALTTFPSCRASLIIFIHSCNSFSILIFSPASSFSLREIASGDLAKLDDAAITERKS